MPVTYLRFFDLLTSYREVNLRMKTGDSTAVNTQIGKKETNKNPIQRPIHIPWTQLKDGTHLYFKTLKLELSRKDCCFIGCLFYFWL